MRISALEGCRVALWGWGRESRAAYRAFRAAFPKQSLTLFCTIAEATEVQALTDPVLSIETEVSVPRLAAFDVVIKSPGISPYSPLAVAATAAGAHFIGGTQLWFAAHADTDGVVPGAVCVTGTKGKSTTTALLAHLLRAAGHCTALAGNIGLPLLELLTPQLTLSIGPSNCPVIRPQMWQAVGASRAGVGVECVSRALGLAWRRAALYQ